MRFKRSIVTPLVVALIALATGGWLLQRGVDQGQNVYANERLFQNVVRYVQDRFVDQKDPADLYRMATDGMLRELGDPHTQLMPAKEYEALRLQTEGEYGGLGIQIGKRDGWISVIAPLPGTPGERAGLRGGDRIVEVNGESTKDWSDEMAVNKLRGPKGTPVDLKVARLGVDEPIPFHIVRDEIHVKSVPAAYMLPGGVGYVQLIVFSESSTDEVRQAIDSLRARGAKGIILDMRGNPGGLLDQGVGVADLFLKKGDLVVETRSRVLDQNQKADATTPDDYPDMPIVVMVDGGSASATEIVAGALQDHDRALVLGRTSYGKGSVQTVYPLSQNYWLKMTTARWYTPSGRSIQGPYGINAPPADGGNAVDGQPQDSVKDRPEYHTDDGRVVYGGGGITPDLLVSPDTTTLDERAFYQQSHRFGSEYYDARFAFAVRYAKDHPDLKPNFPITPAMLDGFYAELQKNGVKVDRSAYDKAARPIGYELGYEITYTKWGAEGARQRQNHDDPQVKVAADLLRKAHNLKALFAVAAEYQTQAKQTATANGNN